MTTYRIRVDGEGTLPRFYETELDAAAAYRSQHDDHCARVGVFTLEEVVPVALGDLVPNLRLEAFQRMGELRGDESHLDAIAPETWEDFQRFMVECANEFARMSGIRLDDWRVVSRKLVRITP